MLKNMTIELAKVISCSRLLQEPSEVPWVSSCSGLCQHPLLLSRQFIFKQDKLFSYFLITFCIKGSRPHSILK